MFAKTSSGITSRRPTSRAGKLGIPGRYGSSWIMLQALLGSAGLTPDDLEIVEYPDYGQGAAVAAGAVDAATGFANNEPVQLELDRRADDGPARRRHHAAAGQRADHRRRRRSTTKRDAHRGVRRRDPAGDGGDRREPDGRPGRGDHRRPGARVDARRPRRRSSTATIDVWTGPAQAADGLGAIDPADWDASIAYLTTLGLVPNPVTADQMLDTTLLPARD